MSYVTEVIYNNLGYTPYARVNALHKWKTLNLPDGTNVKDIFMDAFVMTVLRVPVDNGVRNAGETYKVSTDLIMKAIK